ncbi:hypothetical protein BST61_g6746 [Cercospora zeina]
MAISISYYDEDYDSSQHYLKAEGWEAQSVALDKAEEDDPMLDSTSPTMQPGAEDPGLEALGFGRGRLGSQPPALSHGGSRNTSCSGSTRSDETPGLSYSRGSSTMEDRVMEEPEASMERDDQTNTVCDLSGGSPHEHTEKQTKESACEGYYVTPVGFSQPQASENGIVEIHAGVKTSRSSSPQVAARKDHSRALSSSSPIKLFMQASGYSTVKCRIAAKAFAGRMREIGMRNLKSIREAAAFPVHIAQNMYPPWPGAII